MKKIIVGSLFLSLGLAGCALFDNSSNGQEKPGLIEKAPAGKYSNESGTVWEEPEFFDDDNGTAAEVPM